LFLLNSKREVAGDEEASHARASQYIEMAARHLTIAKFGGLAGSTLTTAIFDAA
jgi:hypothetical protein